MLLSELAIEAEERAKGGGLASWRCRSRRVAASSAPCLQRKTTSFPSRSGYGRELLKRRKVEDLA